MNMSALKSPRKLPLQKISVKTLEAVITRGEYSFLPVSKSLSLKQFVKAYRSPCCIVTQSHFNSFLGTVNIADKQILAVTEVKQARVAYGSAAEGESFTIPASCTDVLFAPFPPEGMNRLCTASELLASKLLPAVVVPQEAFTDANGREVDSGIHLFLPAKSKGTLFRNTRKSLKAMSADGQVVIDVQCQARFCTKKIGLSVEEIAANLSLPLQVKPISDDEDLNGIPHLFLNEVVTEDIIMATVKFDGRMQSTEMEIPSSSNVDVVILQPIATQEVVRLIEMANIDQAAVADLKKHLEDQVPPPLPEKGDALPNSLPPKPPLPKRPDSSSSSESGTDSKCEVIYDELQDVVKPGNQYVTQPMQDRGRESLPTLPSGPPSRPLPYLPVLSSPYNSSPFTSTRSVQSAGYQPPRSIDYTDLLPSNPQTDSDYCVMHTAAGRPGPTMNPLEQPQQPREQRDRALASMPVAASVNPSMSGAFPPNARCSMTYDTMSMSSVSQYSDPKDENIEYLKTLSCIRVLHLLESMHLECYCEAFRKEQIDGEVLSSLDDEMLMELGVKSSLHRLRLRKVISGVQSAKDHLDGNALSV